MICRHLFDDRGIGAQASLAGPATTQATASSCLFVRSHYELRRRVFLVGTPTQKRPRVSIGGVYLPEQDEIDLCEALVAAHGPGPSGETHRR